ncbi:F-box/LRR-repeat protein [Corchorus capsularis]|uniref:F-box/LRR-repeat protein n=1 Tax=Corchorus capsularis TaxID=210143 RepID=A0A1R3GRN8_COCAP|nr:F-box/LRR-repeat protein [Corchorus capsularis]
MKGNDAYGNPLESWRQSISKIVIPFDLVVSDNSLLFIATRTPGVESLSVLNLDGLTKEGFGFARAMCYWKNITHLAVGYHQWGWNVSIEVIGKSCPQLRTLEFHGNLFVGWRVAPAIAKYLRKLTTLRLQGAAIVKEAVEYIFRECPELEVIHFSDCRAVYGINDGLILDGRI